MGNTNDRNAGSVVAGFVYQIYYFLYRLLTMGVDETVSLEKFEDVHFASFVPKCQGIICF